MQQPQKQREKQRHQVNNLVNNQKVLQEKQGSIEHNGRKK